MCLLDNQEGGGGTTKHFRRGFSVNIVDVVFIHAAMFFFVLGLSVFFFFFDQNSLLSISMVLSHP